MKRRTWAEWKRLIVMWFWVLLIGFMLLAVMK